MRILHLEDNVFKRHDIGKAIERGAFSGLQIEWVENLADGIRKIEESIEQENPFDLIITDMWYPESPGGAAKDSGEILISRVKEKGWNIPIILISSIDYSYPEIHGSIHYSKNEDWETELVKLIKKI